MNKHLSGYRSSDLTVYPDLGYIENSQGDNQRLGPVNMRVLTYLLEHQGKVVSRNELFDNIWTNQTVSDDTLTRSVSDIRANLAKLSTQGPFIETLPKRGYRWKQEVNPVEPDNTAPSTEASVEASVEVEADVETDVQADVQADVDASVDTEIETKAEVSPQDWRRTFGQFAMATLGLGSAFVLLASVAVWGIASLFPEHKMRIVVLPTQVVPSQTQSPEHRAMANEYHSALVAQLVANEGVQILAKSAVDVQPNNPFPYYYQKFGVYWLVESQVSLSGGRYRITTTLVDARTAIVSAMEVSEVSGGRKDLQAISQRYVQGLQALLQK